MSAANPPVRQAHASLYHGAKTAGVVAYLVATAALVDLLTTTETKRRVTRRLRARLVRRWRIFRRGEYLVAFRRRRFRNVRGSGRLLRLSTVHRVSAWRDLWVHRRVLVDRVTDEKYLILVVHLAARVESGSRYRSDARYAKDVRTHREGIEALGERIAAEQDAHPDWHVIVAGDFNTNFRDPAWIEHTEDTTGLTPCWKDHDPKGGTHDGGRAIDAICADEDDIEFTAARRSPVKKPDDVDHVGVFARYRPAA